MFENYKAEDTLPWNLQKYMKNENLKVKYEDFDNIFWFLIEKDIYIKNKLHIYKKRFTIAHEVWHYYYGSAFSIDFANFKNNPFEKEADEYAINQLVDTEELKLKVKESWSLSEMEDYFWVPWEEILRKIKKIFKKEEINFVF